MEAIKTDMNTVFTSMTSWWTSTPASEAKSDSKEDTSKEKKETPEKTESADSSDKTRDPEHKSNEDTGERSDKEASGTEKSAVKDQALDLNIEEISTKAVETAKEWGSYLYSFGKTATVQVTEQVAKTAKQIKDTIDDKTMIGDFNKEQSKFVAENTEKKKKSEASVPAWVGYNEEEAMKTQILALSSDKRNFLRNPPAGVQFNFDFEASFPVAAAMLQEDPKLNKMRFELVPKQIKEDVFWRNYFYRVSLIKQSAQLTSLAQRTGTSGGSPSRSGDSTPKEAGAITKQSSKDEVEDFPPSSPPDHEFVSDAFQENSINEEDIKKEMQQLGMSDKEEDIPEWEQELQAELQEYEVVDDGSGLDDADLEQEILDQLKAESDEKKT